MSEAGNRHSKTAVSAAWGEIKMVHIGHLRRVRGLSLESSLAAICIASLAVSVPAAAQDQVNDSADVTAADVTTDEPQQENSIVVTGSRIARQDLISNTPVVTIGQETLAQKPDFAIETTLQKMPQFGASLSSSFNTAYTNPGAATLNLRNLGDNRNLVLLDGRRLQPATANFSIDVNSIPSSLIDSVEVITGGASAVYGSDAVSGVINFKLKRHFEGVELDGQAGISEHGDSETQNLSLTVGGNFGEDRGNAVFVVDYAKREGIRQTDRDFYLNGYATSPVGSPFPGQGFYRPQGTNAPSQAAIDAYFGQFGAAPGSIRPTTDLGFNDAQSLFNISGPDIYNLTSLIPGRQAISQVSPTSKTFSEYVFLPGYVTVPLERYSMFGRASWEVNDNINIFAQGYYTHSLSKTEGGPAQFVNLWQGVVARDAAHPVSPEFAALLDSRPNPNDPWRFGKSALFMGQRIVEHQTDVFQALVGADGKLGLGDWTWDLSASHGQSTLTDSGVSGFARGSRYQALISAPNYGANYTDASGSCTSGLAPFGVEDPTQDCIDYITGHPVSQTQLKQDVVELNLQGSLLELPAGQVRLAVGAGYRKNSYESRPDTLLTVARTAGLDTDYVATYATKGVEGSIAVKEFYAEMLVPLLADIPLIQSLEASLAYRYSDYNTTGGVHTYKADLNWQVFDALRLRGGYQRAVRAPNVTELFQPSTPVTAIPQDLCQSNLSVPYSNTASNPNRANVQQLCRALMGAGAPPITDPGTDPYGLNTYLGLGSASIPAYVSGNLGLRPEKADTFTGGLVFQPHWALPLDGRVNFTVDYYNIKVNDAISFVSSAQAYDFCFNANGSTNPSYDPANQYCAMISRLQTPGSNGIPNFVRVSYQNQGMIKTSGIDVQMNASIEAGPGRLSLSSFLNYLQDYKIQVAPGSAVLQYAGHSGGSTFAQPAGYFKWKAYNTLSYTVGQASIGLRWQYLSAVDNVAKVTAPTSTQPDVPAYNLFDLTAQVGVGEKFTFRAGVTNLFDKQPPQTGLIAPTTDPYDYDIIGRRFYLGVKVKL
jgi:outer membrane receptor protein involved in Fe transport